METTINSILKYNTLPTIALSVVIYLQTGTSGDIQDLRDDVQNVRGDIQTLRTEMTEGHQEIRAEMVKGDQAIRAEMNAGFQSIRTEMAAGEVHPCGVVQHQRAAGARGDPIDQRRKNSLRGPRPAAPMNAAPWGQRPIRSP